LSRRGQFERWRAGRPEEGDWWVAAAGAGEVPEPLDALDMEELNKDRVRLLIQRYGILFRELLTRELPVLQWSRVFRTLRIMDLSGEVLSGRFFEGIPGLQFISPAAFRRLREGIPEDAVYWMNATDPASLCGLGLEELKGQLPARRASSHLVYHGSRIVVISQRSGAELEIRVPFEHPNLSEYVEFLGVFLTRRYSPRKAVTVESINGEPAIDSPYRSVFEERFQTSREPAGLKLRRRF
jgi:ATP-dependent Lhr-like helicase